MKKTDEIVLTKEQYKRFCELGFPVGRMISGSKSGYIDRFPTHVVYFNANIITDRGKIWWGDLDLTKDEDGLKQLANYLGEDFYILSEHDARWGNEDRPTEHLKTLARKVIKKDANPI